jgi:hypothetical protein
MSAIFTVVKLVSTLVAHILGYWKNISPLELAIIATHLMARVPDI